MLQLAGPARGLPVGPARGQAPVRTLRLRVTGEFMEFLAQMPGSGTCHVGSESHVGRRDAALVRGVQALLARTLGGY